MKEGCGEHAYRRGDFGFLITPVGSREENHFRGMLSMGNLSVLGR